MINIPNAPKKQKIVKTYEIDKTIVKRLFHDSFDDSDSFDDKNNKKKLDPNNLKINPIS